MTERANQLTIRAKPREPTNPAAIVLVFVNALERLGYSPELLLAGTGVSRKDLETLGAAIHCSVIGSMLASAMQARP